MWTLVKLTGWTLGEIDRAPAALLDWFIAFAQAEARVDKAKAKAGEAKGQRHGRFFGRRR